MGIPDSVIDEVRQRADLVDIVSEHTRLKRSGKTFRGPCPLHGGEGPNFSVDPVKQIFKCFSCGEGGDLFSFVMKKQGLGFLDAVKDVAERVGVEIPDPRQRDAEADPHARHYEANAFAADWFRRQLWEGKEGEAARAYLKKRGISNEAAEKFGLGWAPEQWTAFGDAARRQGIGNDLLLELGLVKQSTKGGREPYDAFRGRLIFPIEDLGGRVVAFGGRILGAAEENVPKYLNSPETPIYHKGDTLYGLRWSRGPIRKAETALVVEGYMDYAMLAANGVDNAVAPLGTAMTPKQAELIARYAERVILLYDSDMAGLKATFRSGDELLRAGVEVLVATLPDGEDPDSLVRSGGAAALREFLRDAVDVLERKIQILDRRDMFTSLSDKRRAIDALLPTVRAASDEVLRELYITRIAEKAGVPRDAIEGEVASAPARDTRPPAAPERRQRQEGRRAEDFSARPALQLGAERNLMLLFLRDPSWIERAGDRLGAEDFRDPIYRALYEELLNRYSELHDEGSAWVSTLPETLITRAQELAGHPEGWNLADPGAFFEENLRDIQARNLEARKEEIDRLISVASPEEAQRLAQEKLQIKQTMEKLGMIENSARLHQQLRDR